MPASPTGSAARNVGRHSAVVHDVGGSDERFRVLGDRVDATLILEDGRTVQVGLLTNGHVSIRAWAAEPYVTNNAEACGVSFILPTIEAMILHGEQVSEMTLRTGAFTEQSLTSPNRDGCWHLATTAIQDRVTAIRTMLSLRRESDSA